MCDRMGWAGVTEDILRRQREISTDFGQTLSWDCLCWAREHPLRVWSHPTVILYAERDNLTTMKTIRTFADAHAASLTICDQGEHWFHTPGQLAVLRNWEEMHAWRSRSRRMFWRWWPRSLCAVSGCSPSLSSEARSIPCWKTAFRPWKLQRLYWPGVAQSYIPRRICLPPWSRWPRSSENAKRPVQNMSRPACNTGAFTAPSGPWNCPDSWSKTSWAENELIDVSVPQW